LGYTISHEPVGNILRRHGIPPYRNGRPPRVGVTG
jgi:hypothetical protein